MSLRSGTETLGVKAGEVHLLMGENGAGKSTLMKIVAGMFPPDAGEMLWNGQPISFKNPADAQAHGIAMVHQECLLAQHLSVAENIFLGRQPRGSARTRESRRRMEHEAARLIQQHNFPLQADWIVQKLSPAQKQLVEICRAIQAGSGLLIFDEPTSSLSESETKEVFRIVRELRERGTGVIYITHRLDELRSVGDRVTIFRDGESGPYWRVGRTRHGAVDQVHGGSRSDVHLLAASRSLRGRVSAGGGRDRARAYSTTSVSICERARSSVSRVCSAREEPSYAGRFSVSIVSTPGPYGWMAKLSIRATPDRR